MVQLRATELHNNKSDKPSAFISNQQLGKICRYELYNCGNCSLVSVLMICRMFDVKGRIIVIT